MDKIEEYRKEVEFPLGDDWQRIDDSELEDYQIAEVVNLSVGERIIVWYDDEADVRPFNVSLKREDGVMPKFSLPTLDMMETTLELALQASEAENTLEE